MGRPVLRSRSNTALELVGLAAVILIALALRLPNLDVYTASLSEGIRVEQLLLLSAGYRACEDVFCNQGPFALQAMYPTFALFGQTLAAARSSAVIGSLLGLVATYWIARQLWDRATAVLAALLLAVSAVYLKASRLAFPEIIALAPAILAVGVALRYHRTGRLGWLFLAGGLLGASLLVKPIAAPAVVPVALAVAGRLGTRRRDLLLVGSLCAGVVIAGCLIVGLPRIWEQIVFRWHSRLAEGRGIDWNWGLIVDELGNDQVGIFALAAVGALGLVRTERRSLAVIGGWALANLALLLVHTPLHFKHVVIMLPPLALLSGYTVRLFGCWALPSLRARSAVGGRRSPVFVAAALGVVAYAALLPRLAARDAGLVTASEMIDYDPAQQWHQDASAALLATTPPGSFVVTDFPYIAFAADRLVPPQLVESSLTRIRAGSLTDSVAITEASRFDPQAVLLWWDRLIRLPDFKRWVDQRYQLVRVYAADREAVTGLYLPLGSDVGATRTTLSEGAGTASGARFGSGLIMTQWGLDSDSAAPGERRSLTIVWQAHERLGRNLAAVLSLRSRDRAVWTSQRLPLLGTDDGRGGWTPGRWIVWSGSVYVPPRLAPGSYVLSVRIAEGDTTNFLPVQPPVGHPELGAQDPRAIELAVLEVSGAAVRKRSS
jgi:Dolichyl-phosphate-mannose-protein mannosyltransferase